MKEAKAVKTIRPQRAIQATVTDSLFFKYMIQDTSDLERMQFLLKVSQKENLQIYLHKERYPGQASYEHSHAVGDLPEQVLLNMQSKGTMLDIVQDMTPFKYCEETDSIQYQANYRHMNTDLFKAQY